MNKIILATIALILNFTLMGWLVYDNSEKKVTIVEQSISIENGKEKIKEWSGLYDKKVKELRAKEAINKRMEDELKQIKDKVNRMGIGDRFNFDI